MYIYRIIITRNNEKPLLLRPSSNEFSWMPNMAIGLPLPLNMDYSNIINVSVHIMNIEIKY
jgi:hypothetical protein